MSVPLAQSTDEELIAEFQRDNIVAFNLIVGRYKDQLTNFVYRLLGDYDECQDIVQETFIRVYRNRQMYKPVAKFSTWIYTIAGNLAKTELRRKERRRWLPIFSGSDEDSQNRYDIPDTAFSPDVSTDSSIKSALIQGALGKIPRQYREMVILRDVQELSYDEISKIAGVSIGTVKSRINRGRIQLQKLLKDIYKE
jgi:RNA polymerase sigma-70 factor (ECF subfamily)